MKLLRMLLILWKYRKYDTIYFIHDTSRLGDIVVNIRLAKLMNIDGQFYVILLLDGSTRMVHRSWTAEKLKEARKIKKEIIRWEKDEYYDIIDRTTKR